VFVTRTLEFGDRRIGSVCLNRDTREKMTTKLAFPFRRLTVLRNSEAVGTRLLAKKEATRHTNLPGQLLLTLCALPSIYFLAGGIQIIWLVT
jgi:hypothetical protein